MLSQGLLPSGPTPGMLAAVAQNNKPFHQKLQKKYSFMLFFSQRKYQICLVISYSKEDYSNFKSPVTLSINFQGQDPIEIQVVVPGAI